MAPFWNTRAMLEKRQRAKHAKWVNEEGLDGFDWYEGQPKWPLTRIVDVAFAVIAVFVWAVILFRIFSSQNAEFEKMILLNENARQFYTAEESEVLRIHSSTADQEDGSVLVYYPVYLEEADNFQFTARVRRKAIPPGKGETGYTFILRESGSEGDRYFNLSYFCQERNFSYTYFRLCFEGVELKEDCVYTFLVFDGGYEPTDESSPYPVTESRFHFTLYNSDTYTNKTAPKTDVFKDLEEMQ